MREAGPEGLREGTAAGITDSCGRAVVSTQWAEETRLGYRSVVYIPQEHQFTEVCKQGLGLHTRGKQFTWDRIRSHAMGTKPYIYIYIYNTFFSWGGVRYEATYEAPYEAP